MSRFRIVALSAAFLPFAAPATAGDAFYFDISGGPAALMIHMNDDAMDDLMANTYWGIDGRFGICSQGMFNICGGLTGYTSLGSTSESLSARYGAGTAETQFSSIGGYVQGKANLGIITLSPYAGYRQFFGEVETSSSRFGYQSEDIDSGALYGGLETSIKFVPTGLELGARFEYGGSTADSPSGDFDYGLGSAFLRFKF